MIELGSIPVDSPSSVFDVRRKIARLAEALRLDAVTSTWLATVTSEVVRRLSRDQHEPCISIGLIVDGPYAGLVLVFEQRGNVPETGRLLHDFDEVRTVHADDGYHGLWTCRRFLTRDLNLSEAFIREQRARIQQPSRTELMHRLQATNEALERHRDHLEATVAERTTALAQQTLEATLLHRTMQIANEAHTFEEALQRVLALVCELAKWPVGHIYEPAADEADKLVPTTLWHLENPERYAVFREVTERTPFVRGEGLPGRVLASGKPAWIVNVQVDTNFPRNKLASDLGVKGAFCFPVHVGSAIVAVLEFFADEEISPDESLLDIVHSVGVQLGKVLERKLSEEALRKAHEEMHQKNEELQRALQELQATQTQLVQSEKMAVLGQLIASVAHEINSPLGAIRSSIGNISSGLGFILQDYHTFVQTLSVDEQAHFLALLKHALDRGHTLSSREARKARRALRRQLEAYDVAAADTMADALVDMGILGEVQPFLPLFRHAQAVRIVETAYRLSGLHRSADIITLAADRAAKIIFALKNYARYDHSGEKVRADVVEGLETVLTLYHNTLKQGVEVVRDFGAVEPILCYPDELNQVWTNLIHNAIQAMKGEGTLTVGVQQVNGQVLVTVGDNGPGIPEAIRERIFEPFVTTKAAGEGSGLGLDIVWKIIAKHEGTITLETETGQGTTFLVYLPADEPL